MNLIEQVEAQVQARMREDAPARGNMLTTAECLREAREDQPAVLPPALQKRGLAGREFLAAVAADRPARKVEFSIDGNPGWVRLRKMGDGAMQQYLALLAASVTGESLFDGAKARAALLHLLSHTVTAGVLPRRKGEAWEELVLADTPEAREAQFAETEWDTDFAAALVAECDLENGLTEEQQGN
jgi:hypothetical protein